MTDRARPLCVSPRCRIPGRHTDTCPGDCRGCLVALAADGLRLCGHCARRIGTDAVKLAELYDELELMLRPAGTGAEGHGQPGSASPPRDAVVAIRTEIRNVLVSWVRLVAEERGIGLPQRSLWVLLPLPRGVIGPLNAVRHSMVDNRIGSIAAYLVKHATWLAAHPAAGECVDELASLVSRAWSLAYPSGTHAVEVGPCPRCDGTLTAIVRAVDNVLPSEVVCDADPEHRWTADRWRELDRLVMAKRRAA